MKKLIIPPQSKKLSHKEIQCNDSINKEAIWTIPKDDFEKKIRVKIN